MIEFGESGHPAFRATSPLSRGTLKSKGGGKLSMHVCADGKTIEFFSHIFFCHRLSIHGAVSDLCDQYRNYQARAVRLVLSEQSDSLFEPASLIMKTPILSTKDLAQEDLLRKYQERVERLSQQSRVIKICLDEGFLTPVEVGQYFITKRTLQSSHNLQNQWHVVCTLCQEMRNHLARKVGFEGTPNLGPC